MPVLDVQPGIAICLHQRFNTARERVFRAWTDPAVLKRWWCPEGWTPAEIEIDLRVGGAYRIGMQKPQNGRPVYIHGHFLDIRAPERLVYTWQWANAFEEMPETCVTVQFFERDGGTELVLSHDNLPEIPVCLQHWHGWLAAFKRIHDILDEAGKQ